VRRDTDAALTSHMHPKKFWTFSKSCDFQHVFITLSIVRAHRGPSYLELAQFPASNFEFIDLSLLVRLTAGITNPSPHYSCLWDSFDERKIPRRFARSEWQSCHFRLQGEIFSVIVSVFRSVRE